ncbi:cytochrome c5 [Legionella drozanskii LLAP-1]|uniref:Cytochrome c5 n=2 Tax=Legionellaceae TaxID=444 RepID=A0A0W0SVP3_9GAMM|nr:cytochrome c5 [Legionella drozanskii LLAP-1]PJE08444.1 MAG: cytochrome c5 family protein [Legionella sp.]
MRYSFFFLIAALSLNIFALVAPDKQQIEERIKPIGQVRIATQDSTSTKKPVQSSSDTGSTNTAGQATYEQYCSTCHRDGLAGAPKFGVKEDWQPRLDKQALDGLVTSAIKGLNAMPMRGTCMQCSDEEIKNAIQYMLPQS